MSKSYKRADVDTLEMLDDVIDSHSWFSQFRGRVPVTFDVLQVATDDGKPALKFQGSPAIALAKIRSLEERAAGYADVLILIDEIRWNALPTDRRRRAILADALCSLSVDGEELDDARRPTIKAVPYDFVVRGFTCVAEWYGKDSVEVIGVQAVSEHFRQRVLGFAEAAPDRSGQPTEDEDEDERKAKPRRKRDGKEARPCEASSAR